jgi:hypothetical protein
MAASAAGYKNPERRPRLPDKMIPNDGFGRRVK